MAKHAKSPRLPIEQRLAGFLDWVTIGATLGQEERKRLSLPKGTVSIVFWPTAT